jgi:hypothetical protein
MTQPKMDPDVTRRDDGPYWAAALVLAIRAGDRTRADKARRRLRRLGYSLDIARTLENAKGVRNVH